MKNPAELETMLIFWGAVAKDRGDIERLKSLWRILDALAGMRTAEAVAADLDALKQTDIVAEIRQAVRMKGRKIA